VKMMIGMLYDILEKRRRGMEKVVVGMFVDRQ
jgi:hypothetical protein